MLQIMEVVHIFFFAVRDLSRPRPSFMDRDSSFQTATTMLASASYQEPLRSFSTPQPGSFSFRSPMVSVTPQQETLQGNPVIQDSLVTTSTSLASTLPPVEKESYPQSLPPNYPGNYFLLYFLCGITILLIY